MLFGWKDFCLVLSPTANGIAFCWGDNSAGQVGVPTTAYGEITQPRPLVTPTGTRPKQITCGANYTAIITSE